MKTYHYVVKGRVQGVGYRYFATLMAKKYEITGSVENLSDGDVEVYAQGEDKNIASFKSKLLMGPMFSKVEKIDEEILNIDMIKTFQVLN